MTTTTQVQPFQAIAISRLAHALKAQGRSIIHMEFGQPSGGAPAAATAAAQQVLSTDPMGYWESAPLRERLARHYADWYGLTVDPDRFVLTCGASPALVLALLTSFTPGERIAFARPGYVAYRNTVRALHFEPVEIGCGPDERFQLTAKALAELSPAPSGVIIASPANPTGTIISPDELAAIAEVCRARGVKIISDEIYHGLSYGPPVASLLQFDPSAQVLGSYSKYFGMSGWRLGWLLAGEAQAELARTYISNLFLTPPALAQHAALAAMDCAAELDARVEVYAQNRAKLMAALPAMGLGGIAPPDGAFYIWADVGHLTDDSLSFCRRLLEDTGLAIAPGVDFDPVDGGRHIRFSFAVSGEETDDAIRRLGGWLAGC